MKYYLVAEDAENYLEFSVTFQIIDKRHVFPTKDQAEAAKCQQEADDKEAARRVEVAVENAKSAKAAMEAALEADAKAEAAKKALHQG